VEENGGRRVSASKRKVDGGGGGARAAAAVAGSPSADNVDQIQAEVGPQYAPVQTQVVAEMSGQPAVDALPVSVCS
jgi:hypothetical protein